MMKIIELIRKCPSTIGKNLLESLKLSRALDLPLMSSSLAFTTILSIVPLFAVLFYIFESFGGLNYVYLQVEPYLLSNLSAGAGESVISYLRHFISQAHAHTVGWAGIAGLLVTNIFTYFTISKIFNKIWVSQIKQSFSQRIIRALSVMILGPALAACSIGITAFLATQFQKVPYSSHLLTLILNVFLYAIVYTLIPAVKIPFRIIFSGSILPALLWEGAKVGYAFYTTKIVKYSAFYGSFAILPLLFVWIYIAWYITLFGGVWIRSLHLQFQSKHID